jgi:uncharacterized protein (DUF58 family)
MLTGRVAALFGALGGLSLVAGWLLAPDRLWVILAATAGVVLLLVAVDWVLAAPVGRVRLSRSGVRELRLGATGEVTLTVTNDSPRPLRALVRDAWVPSAGASGPYAHPILVEPGESARIVTPLTPTRRGARPAVRVTVRSYGPFGLAFRQPTARRSSAMTPPWTVTVLPPFTSRRLLPEKLARLRIVDGQVVVRGRGSGTEFDSLREYVTGDDVRSIDWRGTARREHMVVRTWRPERDRRVLCVIDTGRTSAGRVGVSGSPEDRAAGEPRLDTAIDAALLLTALATAAGDRVSLLAVDTAVRTTVATVAGSGRLARLGRTLAHLRPALVETDFHRIATEVLRIERRRSLVVIFTTLDPGQLEQGLLPVLPRLVARHRVVVAGVADPALAALAAGRGDAAAVHTAAAAHRTLDELDRFRSVLAGQRVEVVHAPPETFASAVADRYLALKLTGQL